MAVQHPTLDLDVTFSLLSSEYRRHTLRLLDREGEMTLDRLARKLRNDIDEETTSITIQLHHDHLPKLADEGMVQYAVETNTVSITREGRRLLSNLIEIEAILGSRIDHN